MQKKVEKSKTSIKKLKRSELVTNTNSNEVKTNFWSDLVKYWHKIPKPLRWLLKIYIQDKLEDIGLDIFHFIKDENSGWFNQNE